MYKKLPTLFIILIYFTCHNVSAQNVFSDYLPNARSVGLGWSAVALVTDPSTGYWNPANLAFLTNDQIVVNVNDISQFDLTGFSKFFPPKIGLGVNVFRSMSGNSKYDLSSIALGYRVNSSFAIGSNINIGRRESREFFSSFGLGIFIKSFPDYRNNMNLINPVWKWFRSKSMKDKLSIGITFHNFPIQNLKNTQQLRAAIALKLSKYAPLLHIAYHLSPKNYSLHFGTQIDLIKNINLYFGMKDFDANQIAIGSLVNLGSFSFELSYVPESKQYYFSFYMTFSENQKERAQKFKNTGAQYIKRNDFISGLKEYEKAFAYDPEDGKLNFLISILKQRVDKRQKRIDSLTTEAVKLERQKIYASAFQIYKNILEIDPHNKPTRKHLKSLSPKLNKYLKDQYELGKDSFKDNKIDLAEEAFRRILTVNKTHVGANKYIAKIDSINSHNFNQFYLRGIGYYEQRNYLRANEEFAKALKLKPTHKKALEYKKLIDNVLKNKQKRITRLLAEADRYERKDLFIKANNRYKQVLNLDRYNRRAIEKVAYLKKYISSFVERKFQKAKQLYNKKEFLAAVAAFKEILSIDPSHRNSRNYLKRAQQGLQNSIDAHLKLAQNYFEQEKWNDAAEECAIILSLNNKHKRARALQSEIAQHISLKQLTEKAEQYYRKKDYRRALEKYDQILKRNPDDKAAKKYQQICEKEMNAKIEELFNQGMVSYSEGDYQEAIKEWNKVLQLDANHKSTLEYIQKATERIEVLSDIK